ncbi:hypothetical protein OJ252_3398 [Cryptosporidium canis]|uniref:Uncharacterized protein n=1 Tax=Cryptosporidium canis TaxID=195482 RepID=A0ABQ8P2G1_9CRYT|nr:hypothetical protein OJ252_3398 [Cryptosporidium canis]
MAKLKLQLGTIITGMVISFNSKNVHFLSYSVISALQVNKDMCMYVCRSNFDSITNFMGEFPSYPFSLRADSRGPRTCDGQIRFLEALIHLEWGHYSHSLPTTMVRHADFSDLQQGKIGPKVPNHRTSVTVLAKLWIEKRLGEKTATGYKSELYLNKTQ